MSLYGAMYSGVSGLTAESSALSAISDNITNVNTIGYKQTDVNFQTLVTKQASLTSYSPGGVQSKPRSEVNVQGLLQSTSSSTDVAISGQGFFVVNSVSQPGASSSGEFGYTRAGSFQVDKSGYLQNTGGYYIQGWPLTNWDSTPTAAHTTIDGNAYMAAYKNSSGNYVYINESSQPNPVDLQSLNLNGIAGTASPTTSIRMGANLPASSAVGNTQQSSAQIYDSLGDSSNVAMTWTATAQNSWALECDPPAGARTLQVSDGTTANNIYANTGRLDFNAMPSALTSSALTMTIGGQSFTFDISAGGNTASTFHIDPASADNVGAFTGNMATAIQTAYQVAYDSTTAAVTADGPVTGALASGSTLSVTLGTKTYTVNLSGDNPTGFPGSINTALNNAGVPTAANGGVTATYAGGVITLTGGAGSPAVTVAGAGDLQSLSGTIAAASAGSVSSTAGALNTSYGTVATGSTLTIGGTAITIVGDTPAQMVAAINAQSGTTNVTASYTAATGAITLDNVSGGNVTVLAAGDVAGLAGVMANGATSTINASALTAGALTIGSTLIGTADLTQAGIIAAINSQTSTTGVGAVDSGNGGITTYNTTSGTVTLSGLGALAAFTGAKGSVTGTGVTYCNQVAGSDSLLFRQFDTSNDITLTGLTSVTDATGGYAIQQTDVNTTNQPAAAIAALKNGFSLTHLAGAVGLSSTAVVNGKPTTPAITFNGDGTPATINVGQIAITWANGSEDQTTPGDSSNGVAPPISFFIGDTNTSDGMTQLSSSSGTISLSYMTQNGAKFGNFSGVSIGSDGVVTALFDNGIQRPIFQIPIATFVNPDGLESLTGNVFISTDVSGDPTLRTAGAAGSGTTTASSLESSTVDIGTQFTDMIVTQRAYSAAAKIITTANQMLDDLMQVVR